MRKILALLAGSEAVTACTLDEPAHIESVQFESTGAAVVPARDAMREALRLYDELAARLDERGVTPDAMQTAVDAGDAEVVRALFGFTADEYAEATARLQAIATSLQYPSALPPTRRA